MTHNHHYQKPISITPPPTSTAAAAASAANPTPTQIRKSKMMNTHVWNDGQNPPPPDGGGGAGVDELLAMLGYKVKPADMDDVALKIEHLDTVFGNDDELSQIVSDSVHYNPSDLNSWLESMICELNPPVIDDSFVGGCCSRAGGGSGAGTDMGSDLLAVAGAAVFPPPAKKVKVNCSSSSSSSSNSSSLSFHPNLTPNLDPNQVVSPNNSASLLPFNPNQTPNLNPNLTPNLTPNPFNDPNLKEVKLSCSSFSSNDPSLTPNLDPNLFNDPNLKEVKLSCSSFSSNDPSLDPNLDPNLDPSLNRSPSQVVIVDSQENGIRLVHTLMACAEAVEADNYQLAESLVKQAGALAVSQAGAMRKVATCFAEALARRIYRLPPHPGPPALSDLLHMHFYETCPYLKFAHFTANQAILEAFAGKKNVHVVDFGMKQGMQWPALMQALALRPGGPPKFRLTGIGPPSGDDVDYLQEVGWKLAQLADTINVEFEFRGFVAGCLSDLDPFMFELRNDEVLAVNSVFELHRLLGRSGGIEKVLAAVKRMEPEIFTVVEQEANHNGVGFLERFTESLHYYSTVFDSLESSGVGEFNGGGVLSVTVEDRIMSEVYLGKQICNVVACEGADRVERHETLTQWKARFDSAGFDSVHLGSNAFKQASMLLALFAGGDGYRVVEEDGCLMLGWHTRPLITTSAWKIR